jgi:hypothetical protein
MSLAFGRFLPFHSTSVDLAMFHSLAVYTTPHTHTHIQPTNRSRIFRVFRSRPEAWTPGSHASPTPLKLLLIYKLGPSGGGGGGGFLRHNDRVLHNP